MPTRCRTGHGNTGGVTHGTGIAMTTSVSSRLSCSSSYSMLTSHLPSLSDGQQLTGEGREGHL